MKEIEKAVDFGYLSDWYINSIDNTIPPIWTDEHIEELLNDFCVIPKEEATEWQKIEKIAEHCGSVKQARKLIEETAELTQAICKYLDADEPEQNEKLEHVYEEMADVRILWEQLAYLFKANDKIDEISKSKINRTLLRLGIA